MTVLTVLRRARALIVKGWTRGTFARDKSGREVGLYDKGACRFCADGALMRAAGETTHASIFAGTVYARAFHALAGCMTGLPPTFNDRQNSKKPVLAAFDAAIKAEARK